VLDLRQVRLERAARGGSLVLEVWEGPWRADDLYAEQKKNQTTINFVVLVLTILQLFPAYVPQSFLLDLACVVLYIRL